ncbi:hypothetical protein [Halorientalis halophila]|uniref:hypothetical protein n=1 Tax=Halorientalis halophila TaxID=3108499 RepID=UPI00300B268E
MTDRPDEPSDDASPAADPTRDEVQDAMAPLEPYTTGELARVLDAPRRLVRQLLDALADEEQIRKKTPEPDRTIWIREPPARTCPGCGRTFEIKFLHPVLSSARFCPRCGAQLD